MPLREYCRWRCFRNIRLVCPPVLAFGTFLLGQNPPAAALELHGFGDVSYHQHVNDDADPDEDNGAFGIGPIDFFIAESLGPHLDVLTEFAIESGSVDLERLLIGYSFSDHFKVSVGRSHTSLGYWNTAYHHGRFLYTTIERPRALRFEDFGGILPLHAVGVTLRGRHFLGAGEVTYSLLVANGTSIVVDDGEYVLNPNPENDPNRNKAVGFRGTVTPSGLGGWAVGASVLNSRILNTESLPAPAPTLTLDVAQTIMAFDVTHTTGPWEVLAEYFLVRDEDRRSTGSATNHLAYVQIGREFGQTIMPYARHERLSVDEAAADPYMLALGVRDERLELVGVRMRLGEQSVLKVEGRFVSEDGTESHQEYAAQWAFTF